ncbi:hypothetical protein GGF32_009920 [Allomyces javanicus]|nr:hypothetical protein GGF32_009920 [Allomyces javanicus]
MGQGQSRVVKLNNAHPLRHKIAVDFGTSHSGFAVSSRDFPYTLNHDLKAKDLSALQKLHIEHHIKYKTAWPGMAFAQYLGMNSEVQAQHIYIDRFKLFLDDSRKQMDLAMEKLEALGKDVVKVIADYLRALAEAIREFVAHIDPNKYWNPYHVRWCLTVPAMWSDAANSKMRKAMCTAGLIFSAESDRLDFCSEPMAGLLFELMSSQSHTVIQKDDLGGGTVDLTAMRMCDSGFKELVPGLGASCGSAMLDVAFLRMFRDVIGAGDYNKIVEKNPQVKAKIRNAWE